MQANIHGILQVPRKQEESSRVFKPPLSKKSVGVFQRRCFPPRLLKVVRQQSLRRRLLSIPPRHPPEPKQHVFLPERQVVQATINGILLVGFRILVTRDDFKLRSLG